MNNRDDSLEVKVALVEAGLLERASDIAELKGSINDIKKQVLALTQEVHNLSNELLAVTKAGKWFLGASLAVGSLIATVANWMLEYFKSRPK